VNVAIASFEVGVLCLEGVFGAMCRAINKAY